MNRRRFLSFIGFAPVAAALPAMALPRPESVKETVGRAGFFMEVTAGEHHARIGASVEYPIDYDGLSRDLEKPLIFKDGKLWINPANILIFIARSQRLLR
ncbi:hypothetical protein [Ochrobactrum sp. Marseille-Q0166]|uniref:hypothetical protein n=1 Tax=Ochrobactrum sp. Marseille-Q0166 TaxID=2761105 RepID=UPI00165560FD|nr:hypothetical protein [Ochrobactrum sp. Marseille-Q0166]MBC8718713.1 hypothetical protein [Ochrobactrum sp. Marseille-Q0166]